MEMKKIPIIIDCDPGTDDTFAIALANSYPGFEIKAITAVEGNVPASVTRKNALCLPDILGFDCRVGFGAELPLDKPYIMDAADVHGASGLGKNELEEPTRKPDEMAAWDLIYDEAVKAEGELILFAVGPLTNIAIALDKHPDLPKYIKKFVIMGGGSFGNVNKYAEFNLFVDPLAGQKVFEQMEVYMAGLDGTHAAAISDEDYAELDRICGKSEKNWLLKGITEFNLGHFYAEEGGHVIHDAVAVASVINPDVVEYVDCHVKVEGDYTKENNGQTIICEEGEINCHMMVNTNQPLFYEMMKEMCEYYNK